MIWLWRCELWVQLDFLYGKCVWIWLVDNMCCQICYWHDMWVKSIYYICWKSLIMKLVMVMWVKFVYHMCGNMLLICIVSKTGIHTLLFDICVGRYATYTNCEWNPTCNIMCYKMLWQVCDMCNYSWHSMCDIRCYTVLWQVCDMHNYWLNMDIIGVGWCK